MATAIKIRVDLDKDGETRINTSMFLIELLSRCMTGIEEFRDLALDPSLNDDMDETEKAIAAIFLDHSTGHVTIVDKLGKPHQFVVSVKRAD